ncbi:MAG: Terminase large subunit [Pseudomonadota bacterium]
MTNPSVYDRETAERLAMVELRRAGQRARQAHYALAAADPLSFAEMVLRDTATGEKIKLSNEQVRWHLAAERSRRTVLWAHDQSGRSLWAVSRILHTLGRNRNARIVIVGRTLPAARTVLGLVARYLDSSPELRHVFPDLRLDGEPKARSLAVAGRVHRDPSVQAVGTGLGLVSRAPIDLLVIDDALADEHVRTPGARQLIRDWFEAVLFASVSPYGAVVALGTPLHPDDAVSRLASQPDVQVVRSPVVDAEGKPTWPEKWTGERVERRKKDMDEQAWQRRMLVAPILSADMRTAAEPLNSFIERVSGGSLIAPRHLAPLVALLERARHEPVRAVVSAPPQHGKSETIMHALAWHLAQDPTRTHAYVTYAGNFATDQSRRIRSITDSAGVEMSDQAALRRWRTARGGGLIAEGVSGQLTGKSVDGIFVIDDPYKDRVEAESALKRERVWQFFTDVAKTRLNPAASVIVVHTRWHEDDLAGRLAKQGWERLNLQAVSPEGVPLWPERYTPQWLKEQREALGEYSWASLYMGEPRPRGGAVFRDVRLYDPQTTVVRSHVWRVAIGVDLAYTARAKADYSTAVVLAADGQGVCYVLDVIRAQVEAPVFAGQLAALKQRYAAPILWYAAGTEQGVAQFIRNQGVALEVQAPKGDKFVRSMGVAAAWNASRISVPMNAAWSNAFVEEVLAFTGVGDLHDDQVDALAAAYDQLFPQVATPTAQVLNLDLRRR